MTDEEFDFSKHEEEIGDTTPRVLTDEMLRRRMVWNVAPCPDVPAVIKRLDLPPVSEDVEDREHEDAHQRLYVLQAYMGVVILALSRYAAEAVRATIIEEAEQMRGEVPDEAVDEMINQPMLTPDALHPIVHNAVSAVLSEMLDVGAIFIATPTLVDIVRSIQSKVEEEQVSE